MWYSNHAKCRVGHQIQIICISTSPQTFGAWWAHGSQQTTEKKEANCCNHCCSLRLYNTCLAAPALPEESLAACPRLCSLIQEVVLLRRKTNHCWRFFCFFLSVIHFNRRPSVVCRWHFFLIPLRHPECITVSLLLNWQELCVFSWYCVALVWRLQHYLLCAGANGCLCALDVCQGWNKYLYFPSTYLFSSALSASKMLLIKTLICPNLFETGETQIQNLVCNC